MCVRGCLVSTMDLKNQFFSIEIEKEDRPKTNFYWQNEIWQHIRLAQGLSISPFIAARAMHMTFSDDTLADFLRINNIVGFPFSKFKEFLKHYLDDCICFTPKDTISDKFPPKKLHFLCLEAMTWALSQHGWIASLNKCNFLKDKFTFLGQEINTVSDTSRMQSSRVAAIQAWRSPKSAAEANSRMAVLSYFSKFCPAFRLIGLPIFHAIKAEKFHWGKLQEIAFNNLKFLISLQISLSHYDPNQVLLITSDASQMSMNASYYNFDTTTCELKLLDTQTKLFTKSEINYAPVQREARSMMFALSHGEPYIRNNAVETWLLVDANSLQYISRNKAYSS